MNYHISLLGVTLMVLSINGMSLPENENALNAVISHANDFTTKFNKVLAKGESGNFICSPFSVNMVLSMVSCGAEGTTKAELQQSLHTPANETVMKNGYQSLIDMLNNIQGVELAVANKIFSADRFKMKDGFKEITDKYFRSKAEMLDFSKAEKSAERINNWAAEHTNNRINAIVKPDDMDNAVMVMANAVYFKGKWAEKFNPSLTRVMPFHIDETRTKNVNMMYREGNYNWGVITDLNAKYIELPYKNENISMFVIVPNEFSGLRNVEENLDKIDLTKLDGGKSTVELSMPKFKIESKFDLKPILQEMNIRDMFEGTANFHGITNTSINVSKVIQKAFIEVNEEGSEAVAVTDMDIADGAMPVLTPSLVINKPFICKIIAKTNEIIQLFNARVMDPSLTL